MRKINFYLSLIVLFWFNLPAAGYAQNEAIHVDVTLIHETDVVSDSNGWAAYALIESFEQALTALGYQMHGRVVALKSIKKEQLFSDQTLKKPFAPAQWAVQILSRYDKGKMEYTVDAVNFFQKKILIKKAVYKASLTDPFLSIHENILIDFLKQADPSGKGNHSKAAQKIYITKSVAAYRFYMTGKILQLAAPTEERLAGAGAWYEKAIQEDPVFFQAYAALAAVHVLKKEYERAFTVYADYLNRNAKAAGVHSAIGDIYYDHLNDTRKAKSYYEKELAVNPGNASVLVRLGYCAYDDKNYELAKQFATQALKINRMESSALNLLGLSAISLKDSSAAKDFFQQAVKVNAYEIPARKNLARMFEIRNRFDEAKELYRQILEADPADAFALMSQANLSYLQNDRKQAAAYYMQAVIVKPDLENPKENPIQIFQMLSKNKKDLKPVQALVDSLNETLLTGDVDAQNAFLYRAAVGYASLYYLNDFTEAANQFQITLKLKPEAARLRFYLAESYFRLEKWNQALDYYRIYAGDAKDSYNFARCYLMIGKILIRQKKFEDARLEILKSLRLYPNAESYFQYGLALKGAKQNEEAIGAFEKAVKTFPNYIEAYQESARTFEEMKKYDKALQSALKAVSLDSSNYYSRQTLSHVYYSLERWEDAEAEIAVAIRLMPEERPDARLYGDYGDILLQQNKIDLALSQYERQWNMDSAGAAVPYRIASIYASKNNETAAARWILKAFHNNFTDFLDLDRNKMFNPVRDKPIFKELVKQYEQAYREELLKRIQQKK